MTGMGVGPLRHGAAGALLTIVLCGVGRTPALAQPTEVAGASFPALRDRPSYLDLGAGAFDFEGGRRSSPSAAARVEFRYGKTLFFIGPAIGLLANTQGGVFGYGGFYGDISFGAWAVTPLIAIGGYHRGGSADLGGTLEGRFSIAIARELGGRSRIGVQFAHISNAGVHAVNPGENELLLSYAIPLILP